MLKKIKNIGPGAMVAAAFIGPGTVTTATIAGSTYGYTLLWAILFSILATFLLQEMSARLGVIGKIGVGEAIRQKLDQPFLKILASVLIIAAILIGNAAYEAGNITGAVLGFEPYAASFSFLPISPLPILIALLAFLLLWSGKYKLIERSLVLMVATMGIVFLLSAILLQPNWGQILKNTFVPTLPNGALIMVIGLIGTTVVPYNLFLHASSVKGRWSDKDALSTSRWDTVISVFFGGLITMAILITSAVAFEGKDKVVSSAADLAEQLNPILGNGSAWFIALGFLAAGLSSSITAPLAAAFATSEVLGWKEGLKGWKFRGVWGFVLFTGLVFSSLGFKPTLVILFAQVANGLLLPIVAAFLLWIMNDKKIMGDNVNSLWINVLGGLVILVTLLLGGKGIWAALG